jgi:hypothetical protein
MTVVATVLMGMPAPMDVLPFAIGVSMTLMLTVMFTTA